MWRSFIYWIIFKLTFWSKHRQGGKQSLLPPRSESLACLLFITWFPHSRAPAPNPRVLSPRYPVYRSLLCLPSCILYILLHYPAFLLLLFFPPACLMSPMWLVCPHLCYKSRFGITRFSLCLNWLFAHTKDIRNNKDCSGSCQLSLWAQRCCLRSCQSSLERGHLTLSFLT